VTITINALSTQHNGKQHNGNQLRTLRVMSLSITIRNRHSAKWNLALSVTFKPKILGTVMLSVITLRVVLLSVVVPEKPKTNENHFCPFSEIESKVFHKWGRHD
jgi:hypothetical protein